MTPRMSFTPGQLGLLLAMAVGWGLNWPIMKMVISEVPPLTFRGFCLFFGGWGLLLVALANGHKPTLPGREFKRTLWLALSNISAWNALTIYGVSMLPSGRAALLGYTMPVWSMLLSVLWLGDRLTFRRALGLCLGMLGVVAMMGTELSHLAGAPPLGALLMLAAALSWAVGVVSLKRFPVPLNPMVLTGWMMVLGSLPVVAGALLTELPRWHVPSLWPALGLVYNVFIAFMFCYWAWNYIVLHVPVAVSSLSSLLTPLIGVVGGMILLGEQPGWGEFLGAAFILGAVATVVLPGRRART